MPGAATRAVPIGQLGRPHRGRKPELLTRAHPSKGGDAKPPVLGAISQDSGAAGSSCLRADSAPARQYRHPGIRLASLPDGPAWRAHVHHRLRRSDRDEPTGTL